MRIPEYITFRSPYGAQDHMFYIWLTEKYESGEWELVCPVNCYVSGGNSRDDYLYVFRRWRENTTPEKNML